MSDSNATSKLPAVHDKGADEIRYTCKCGSVKHIGHPDPFELLSLYQGSMCSACVECNIINELELSEVIEAECPYCEPWYNPKPLFENHRIIVRVVVKDDMCRYVQVLHWFFGKWREWALEPIDKCPICGKGV